MQQTQVNNPAIDLQGVASQDQAMEAIEQVEQEMEERANRARLDEWKGQANKPLTEKLSDAVNSIQGKKSEQQSAVQSSSSSSFMVNVRSSSERKNDKELIEEDCSTMTETIQQIVGSD